MCLMRTAALVLLLFCVGCLGDSIGPEHWSRDEVQSPAVSTVSTRTIPPGPKGGTFSSILSHAPRIFTATKDTWWENISGRNGSLCTSEDSVWAKYPSCSSLLLQRWNSYVGRTYLAVDFDTQSIPENAIITKATIRLYLTNATGTSNQSDPPQNLSCPPCDPDECEYLGFACPDDGDCHNIGVYFAEVDTTTDMDVVSNVVTDVCSGAIYGPSEQNRTLIRHGFSAYATIELWNPAGMVSTTMVTRYGLDMESQLQDRVSVYQFNSADAESYKPELAVEYRTFEFYGATLGAAWAGFDTLLTPDLESSSSYERLDETLPIYLVWKNSSEAGALGKLSTPVALDSMGWWGTTGFSAEDFDVRVYDPDLDVEYHACPEGQGLDEVTLNEDGTLTVRDANFGGIGAHARIELRAVDPNEVTSMVRLIVLQWDNPRTYFDVEQDQDVDAAPNGVAAGIVTLADSFRIDPGDHLKFELYLPTRIVEWVSTDIAGVSDSIRVVNENDLAALCQELGHSVNWGFETQSRTYHLNVNMFGASALYLDAADLALLAADLGDRCAGAAKISGPGSTALASEDRERILAWFGIAATGRMVVGGPSGELVPGFEIVDQNQNRRAIANPFGWRDEEP